MVPDLHGAQPAEAVPVWVRVGRSGETPVLGPEPATPSNVAHAQAMGMLPPEEDKTVDRHLVQAPYEPVSHSSDGLLAVNAIAYAVPGEDVNGVAGGVAQLAEELLHHLADPLAACLRNNVLNESRHQQS